MRLLLFVLGAIAAVLGVSLFMRTSQPLHEIEAFMLFIIASVLITGSALIDTMFYMIKKLKEEKK